MGGKCICSTNLPASPTEFDGKLYEKYEFVNQSESFGSDYICEIIIHQSGHFDYLIEFTDAETGLLSSAPQKGFIIVDPLLMLESCAGETMFEGDTVLSNISKTLPLTPFRLNGHRVITLDSICLLTLVPKWMGDVHEWKKLLQKASETGYNMIHFVPMQERGASNSPYSIKNQLQFSTDLMGDANISSDQRADTDIVRHFLENSRKDLGILFISDVVWNHTSFDSEWLIKNPECGYNLVNSPHLRIAYELDEAIQRFSCQHEGMDMKTVADVGIVIGSFNEFMKADLRLWEFYILDVEKELLHLHEQAADASTATDVDEAALRDLVNVCVITSSNGIRFSKTIDRDVFCQKLDIIGYVKSKKAYRSLLSAMNLLFYQEYDRDISVILKNMKGRVIYERIEKPGPKPGKLCKKYVLGGDLLQSDAIFDLFGCIGIHWSRHISQNFAAKTYELTRSLLSWQIMDGFGTEILLLILQDLLRKRIC